MSKLFCDCKTDEEKSNFFLSGQGVETGIIAPAISNEVAMAFHRCFEFEKQLAAAHAARVSAQASGIRLLDQLTEAKEECDTLRRIHAENITILERKTAQAVAACKLKDEALQNCEGMLDELRDYPITHDAIIEALTIQPDDSALKAWLGEPIGEVKKHTGSLKDMAIIVWSGEQPEEGAQLYIKPKGLK